ncbi:unnamed protein product [Brassicogethes aeneus]|uniref:Uncharacterized protein n=1 Tax=Brassicogethes aeneus TaxID=1431903 RepID=A0A9P0BF77_BRAAE|nr:unnamed protein product [Brassicogethes aeneus]
MAVPFNMPEDHNEVDVYINQLQSLLTQLQIAVRQSRGINPPVLFSSAVTRVRNVSANRRIVVEETDGHDALTADESANNLEWLSSMIQENIQESGARSNSRFCDCDETKINITTIVNAGSGQDWAQIGVALRKIADDLTPVITREDFLSPSRSKESLLSKLPDTITCSIWTAMLGCVGWHIFRAR